MTNTERPKDLSLAAALYRSDVRAQGANDWDASVSGTAKHLGGPLIQSANGVNVFGIEKVREAASQLIKENNAKRS